MNRNKGIIIGAGAILAASLGAWAWTRSSADDAIIYKTASVEKKDLRQTVSATGTVQPFKIVDIKSRAGGEIQQLAVEVGDFVRKGQLIARIDPTDSRTAFQSADADVAAGQSRISQAERTLALQRRTSAASVEQAQAQLASAQAAIRVAQIRLEQARKQAEAQPLLTEADIRQAKASLSSAQEQLIQLQQSGDPQARAEARSALESAKATLDNAEVNLTRQQQLAAKGFVAKAAEDSARAQRDAARAQFNAAKTRFDTVGQGQESLIRAAKARVTEAQESVRTAETNRIQIELRRQDAKNAEAAVAQAQAAYAQAQASMSTARANLLQIGIRESDIETAKANIARSNAQRNNAQIVLGQTTIVAPRDGVVLQKFVEEGTIIASGSAFSSGGGQSIVQLGDLTKVYVDSAVDETDISNVKPDQDVKLTMDSLPDADIRGKVQRIEPRGTTDQNITTIKTRIEITSKDINLRPGLNAECEFIVAEKKDVLVVPSRAIKNENGKKYATVMVDEKTKKTEQREVTVGMETSDAVEILSGLKQGEKVVTARIEPGKGGGDAKRGGGYGGYGGGGGFGGGGGKRN